MLQSVVQIPKQVASAGAMLGLEKSTSIFGMGVFSFKVTANAVPVVPGTNTIAEHCSCIAKMTRRAAISGIV